MPLLNPTFADAGAQPGQAAHWVLTASTNRQRVARFGDGRGREDFEAWSLFVAELAAPSVVRDFFGRDGFEVFEGGWANSAFLVELPTGRVVTATFAGAAVETWSPPTPLLDDWSATPSVAGLAEDFAPPVWAEDWGQLVSVGLATETFSGAWSQATNL